MLIQAREGLLRIGCPLGLLIASVVGGCGATVYPPSTSVADPVPVYVADYGVHSSLLLPTDDGRFVEYAFGDWGYAAENRNGPQDALGALMVSAKSAFGRRYLRPAPGDADPHPTDRAARVTKLYCDRSEVYEVVNDLDRRYEAAIKRGEHPLKNPQNGVEYVHDIEPYSVANNCNHLTARALAQLGCKIEGILGTATFQIAKPSPATPTRISEPVVPGWNTERLN